MAKYKIDASHGRFLVQEFTVQEFAVKGCVVQLFLRLVDLGQGGLYSGVLDQSGRFLYSFGFIEMDDRFYFF